MLAGKSITQSDLSEIHLLSECKWPALNRSDSQLVSRSLRHHLWSCLHRSGSVSRSLRHHLWSCLRRSGSVSRSLRHHLWSCLRRSGSGVSLITSSSVNMSSPVWKWCLAHYVIICEHVFAGLEVFLAHYVIICDHVFAGLEVFLAHYVIICEHVFAGLEVVSRSLRHHLWSCLRRSGSGVSLITSSSVNMSSPVWKWCRAHYIIICDHVFTGLEVFLAHYVIICDHVFAGLEVFLAHYVIICDHVFAGLEVFLAHYVIICDHVFAGLEVFLAHYVIICDHVFAGLEVVSRSLRHHLWTCLRRSGSGVSLITSSSVNMSSPVWKCFSLITSSSVIMSSPVWKWCLAHYVIICDHVFAGLEVVLAHYVIICDMSSPVWKWCLRSLRHHLWSCLRRSGSVLAHYVIICDHVFTGLEVVCVTLITSSSVIMSSPVWKWCLAHYVIICDHVFAGLEVVSRSLRHHLWSCLHRSGSVLAHYVIICDHVFTVWKWCLAHYVIICDHVFGLEVVSRSLRHHLWSCLHRSGSGVSLITSSSVIMSSPVWKWCLAHYVIICDHVFAGLEVVSRSLRHHLWSCLRRSGSGVSLITSSSVIMSSPVWKWCLAHYVIICEHVFAGLEVVSRSLRHHLWSCLRRSGSGVSLITSSSVIMSSPVWKWFLAHYVIICDHVFTGLEVVSRSLRHHLWSCLRRSGSVSRSLRHHLWSCLRRSGSGVSLITSSSVIMSSPVWKCFSLITSSSVIMSSPVWKWCLAHYVIICDHVFTGLEVVSRSLRHHLWSCLRRSGSVFSLITSSSVIMSSAGLEVVSRSLRHHLWSCLRRSGSVSRSLRHHLWSCLRRSGSVSRLITSSSVIMSSPVWKWCLAHYVIICDHVFAGLEVVSRSLRHHLWSCLHRSGSGVSLITSSSVNMSSPVWKCFSLITSSSVIMSSPVWKCFSLITSSSVIMSSPVWKCFSLITSSSVIMSSPVWKCFSLITSSSVNMSSPVWKWCLAHYVIICDHVFAGLEVFLAHYIIICDHVFAGLEVVSRSLRHHLWTCLRRSGSVSRSLHHHLWSCLRRSGSGVSLITSSSVNMSSPVWKWCRAHYIIICDHVFAGRKCFSLITSSSVNMSSPVWKWCLAHYVIIVIMSSPVWKWCHSHYVIICDHVFAGLEVVSRSLRHHLWTCLHRSGSGVSLITSSSVIMSSPVWKWCLAHYVIICDHVFAGLEVVSRSLRHHLWSCLRRSGSVSRSLHHHLWSCLRRSGSGVSLITSSSVIMSSPVWKWCLAHYIIICDHVFAGLEVVSRSLRHHLWTCLHRSGSGVSLITSSSVIMSSPVWKWCLAHYVIICDHVFAGLEVVSRSLRHHLWSCLRRSGSVSRSLRHHLWSCLRRSGSGVSLITSSSVIMSSPVWKCFSLITSSSVIMSLPIWKCFSLITSSSVNMSSPVWKWCHSHYVIICDHVFAGLEVVSRSLRHHLWSCLHRSGSVSRSLRHHLWTCLRRSGSGVSLITSSSVNMSSPVWKCFSLITSSSVIMSSPVWKCFSLITSSSVIMFFAGLEVVSRSLRHHCDHVFAGLEVVSRSLRHHLWSCLRRSGSGVSLITSSSVIMSSPVWKWCLAHYVIICDHVFAGLEVFLAHYVIICDHVFAGLEVVSRSLHHHLWSCLHRSGSVSRSLRHHLWSCLRRSGSGVSLIRHHLWTCLRRSGSGVSLITSSSVIMSSPVWKWCLAHYVIICDHVFAGLEVVSRSLRHHLWSCLRRSGSGCLAHYVIICDHVFSRSGSGVSLITSSSVIMSSPRLEVVSRSITSSSVNHGLRRSGSVSRSLRHHLWSCLQPSGSGVSLITSSSVTCLRRSGSGVSPHYVIICDHVFTGLEVVSSHYVIICDHVFSRSGSGVALITSSSVIMSSPVWKWCLAHYVIICDHVFAGLEVVSRSLRHHLWSCLRRSGSGVSLITSSSVNHVSPVWKWCLAHYVIICDHVFAGLEVVSRSLRHHLWSCLRRSGSGVSLITSSSVIMSSPVWKWCLAHYVIICDHVFAGLEVVSRSLRHHLWSCLRRSGSGVSLITSSSVIMSSPVWKWCLAHYVIICDHVFAGLEVFLAHYVIICDHVFAGLEVVSRSLRHHLWSCLRRSGSVSRSLRHHLWSCLRRSGSGVSLITSSSVIMSSPVWKWCLAHYVIICDHVFAGLEVFLAHYVIICDHVFTGLEVFLAHYVIICDHVFASLEVFLAHYVIICDHVFTVWKCFSLITSSSVIMSSPVWKCFSLITSSSVIMSSPVWKCFSLIYVIICDHVFDRSGSVSRSLRHHLWSCLRRSGSVSRSLRHHLWSCLRRSGSGVSRSLRSSSVNHVFAGLAVVSRSLRHHLWSCLHRSGSVSRLITVIICEHVLRLSGSVSRSLRHHLWSCLRRSGSVSHSLHHHCESCLRRSGSVVSLITSSSVIMSSPVWKCFSLITSSFVIMSSPVWKWCLAHYVIICEHVFAGLEVFLAHYIIICDHVFAGLEVVSRSLRHHLWTCLRRSGSGVALITSSSVIMSSPVWKCFSLITSSSVNMSSPVWKWCLAHYVIICDHVFAGLEVVSLSLRHHLWSCLRRSGSGVSLITSSSVNMSSPVWKWCLAHYIIICDHVFAGLEVVSRSLRHHLWSCLSPVWKWLSRSLRHHLWSCLRRSEVFLAHYIIICDHVFAGLEVVSRSLRHHLWSCLHRSGSGVSLITSSSVIMSSPVWKWLSRSLRHHLWTCLHRSGSGVSLITSSSVIMSSPVWKWCLAHYVIICDHVFAGLEVVVSLITSSSVIMSSPVWKCFSLITSSSVIMSSPVWKWCLAHYVIICDHVFAGLEVFLAHYVIICDHVFADLEVFLAHYVIICEHVFAGLEVVSHSLRHHLWSCLRRSGSGVSLITSSSVIMSSPVWKWCRAHYVIICDHVFTGLEVVSRSLRHHLWSCLHRSGSGVSLITSSSVIMSSPVWKWCLAHYVIICDHVFTGLEVFLAHYVIICDHVFTGLEVVSRSLRHHLWSCLRRSGSVSRSLRHHLWSCLHRSGSVSRSLRHHLWSCLRRSGSVSRWPRRTMSLLFTTHVQQGLRGGKKRHVLTQQI